MGKHKRLCTDGLSVVKVDLYNGAYDFYCTHEDADPQTDPALTAPDD
jgi:hypothetical protein